MDEHCPQARSLVAALEVAVDHLAGVQRRCGLATSSTARERELNDARNRFVDAQFAFTQHCAQCPKCQQKMSAFD